LVVLGNFFECSPATVGTTEQLTFNGESHNLKGQTMSKLKIEKHQSIKLWIETTFHPHMFLVLDDQGETIARVFNQGYDYKTCHINKDYFKNLSGSLNVNISKCGNIGIGDSLEKAVINCFNLFFEKVGVN
tara:strand:+ start:224 stop:616 length:393 start_codon:yes stop_codon:yes gene_type:complete